MRLKIFVLLCAIVLFAGLLVYGCSSSTDEIINTADIAPDFQLTDLAGKQVKLSDFRGRPVILNFWATWCGPCRVEMPHFQQVYEEWSDRGLVVLAVNIGESPTLVKEFALDYGLSFPVLLDIEAEVAQRYNIRPIPTTFFIDKSGAIQDMVIGAFPSKSAIEKKLDKIIP